MVLIEAFGTTAQSDIKPNRTRLEKNGSLWRSLGLGCRGLEFWGFGFHASCEGGNSLFANFKARNFGIYQGHPLDVIRTLDAQPPIHCEALPKKVHEYKITLI